MAVISTLIKTSRDELFSVLTDYERYAEWTADVVSASVLDREGDIVVAEFVSPELIDGKFVLEFVHGPPDSIVYRQVDQFGKRGLQGRWQLAVLDAGSTELTGQMHLRSTVWAGRRNSRRAGLVLRRRVDLLMRMFSAATTPSWRLVPS